jgi:D-alanyl-D-alanine carboxypeptidase
VTDHTVLTEADQHTLLTAGYGTVVLMTAANPGPIASAKSSTAASLAMTSATGLTGKVFAIKTKAKDLDLNGGNTAEIADTVFPALSASMALLTAKAPDEAENFRATITTMTAAAMRSHHGEPLPTEVEMARKIHNALDNA